MSRYAFTLELIHTKEADRGRVEDSLYEAGCDDALVVFVDSKLLLDFSREGASYHQAVATAKRDVEKAGYRVLEVHQIK